ncbi:unannotated protein [freshwater metagenome]|uniref:Unannotated protein n=2 Tax=freshwater metagenome TaxID=449393 RepID=A0A6J6DIR9_9ZZZZ|nr:hypothetical protein [Actinomycetota bacterium]
MRAYETAHFAKLVDEYGLRDHVNQQNERIHQQTQRFDVNLMFDKHSTYLKDRSDHFRLIAKVKNVGDDAVFVWFNIFQRRDAVYEDFNKLPASTIERGFDQTELEKWLAEQELTEAEYARALPLPDAMYQWLFPLSSALVTSADGQELMIYETTSWVRNILDVGRNDLSSFRRTVQEIVEICEVDREFGTGDSATVHHVNSDGTGAVAFRKIDGSSILLLAPLRNARNYKESDIPSIDSTDWKKSARRAYPAYISLDSDLWFDVQNEARANLALSPEEESLLERIAGRGVNQHLFPLFINGSAGSGKSTMLAYVFAGLCRTKQGTDGLQIPGKPVFLTYNEKLVDEARQMTTRILKKNVMLQSEIDFDLDSLFESWRQYLVKLLPYEQRSNFDDHSRIDFHQFKLAYNGGQDRLRPLNQRPNITAEQAWYVIRSLIKGSAPVGKTELSLEDYSELSRQDRVVTEEVFQTVWSTVYKSWYQPALRENALWDDQDLVEQALTNGRFDDVEEEVVALVIDEAQDFTRRELILVARSSAFHRYAIKPGAPVALPIVFAGDPMQSLSPTGFRWDAVQAAIYEELEAICDNAAAPSFEHLTNNYRSTPKIVGFANAIQIMRATQFNLPKSRLQIAWVSDGDAEAAGISPQKFLLGTAHLTESQFMEFARQTIIIVPCEEGGEVHFVQNDPILSLMYPDVSPSQPAGNIFSSAGVKGLEHERVILYKFGESAPIATTSKDEQEVRDLQSEYFFNKLYVAATRATKYLIVVDSKDGDERLWKKLSFDAIKDLEDSLSTNDSEAFGLIPQEGMNLANVAIVCGLDESISQLGDETLLRETNPLQTADKIRDHAIETRNPQSLRQAKSWYRQLGYSQQERLCEGFALKFEGRRVEAAEEFIAANDFREAFDAFWSAGAWDKLGTEYPQIITAVDPSPLEKRAIAFMSSASQNIDSFNELIRELQECSKSGRIPRPSLEQWEVIVSTLRKFAAANISVIDSADSGRTAEVVFDLHRNGFADCASLAADFFMRADQVATAEQIWSQNELPIPQNHARRLHAGMGSPAGLKYLIAAGLYSEILTIWRQAGSPIDIGWSAPVQKALSETNDILGQFDFLMTSGQIANAATLILDNIGQSPTVEDKVLPLIRSYGEKGDVSSGRVFVERINDKVRRTSKNRTKIELIKSTVEGAIQRDWAALPEQQRVSYNEFLTNTYKNLREADRKQLSELYWGAAFELAQSFEQAKTIYSKIVNIQNEPVRRQARIRWAACVQNMGQHVQKENTAKFNDWRISLKKLPIIPVLDPSAVRISREPVGKTSGQREEFTWNVLKGGTRVQVIVAEDDGMVSALIDMATLQPTQAWPGVNTSTTADGDLEISMAGWTIILSKDKERITHTDEFGTSVEEQMLLSPTNPLITSEIPVVTTGKPKSKNSSPSRVTAPAQTQTQTAGDLRKELGLSAGDFDRLCMQSGVRKKGANSRISADEAEKLRDRHQRNLDRDSNQKDDD